MDETVTPGWEVSRTALTTVRSPHLPDTVPKAARAFLTGKQMGSDPSIRLYGPSVRERLPPFQAFAISRGRLAASRSQGVSDGKQPAPLDRLDAVARFCRRKC
jgi:hypothetical protein